MILKLITFLYTKYTILQARFSSCYSFIETETPNEGILKNNRSWGYPLMMDNLCVLGKIWTIPFSLCYLFLNIEYYLGN